MSGRGEKRRGAGAPSGEGEAGGEQRLSSESADDIRRARRWAVVSVVMALVWAFGIASLVAVFMAIPARIELASRPDDRSWRLAADAGLGLGLLGLFVAFLVAVG